MPEPAPTNALSRAAPSSPAAPTDAVPGAAALLVDGVVLGLAGELLLREGVAGAGLGALVALGFVAAARTPGAREEGGEQDGRGTFALGLFSALVLVVRDAPFLRFLAVLGAAGAAVALVARRRTGGVAGPPRRAIDAAATLAAGAVAGAAGVLRVASGGPAAAAARGFAVRGLRTLLVASPVVAALVALFHSADPHFARGVDAVLRAVADTEPARFAVAATLAWAATGALRAAAPGRDLVRAPLPPPPTAWAQELVGTLACAALVYLGFVVSQAGYLFGGAGRVLDPGGPTFATYARGGFFELVTAAALVLPLLVVAERSLPADRPALRRLFRWVALALLALVAAGLASAAHRMSLYVGAYGLTRTRLYVLAFLVWIGAALAWTVPTLLAGRARRFVPGLAAAWAAAFGVLAVAGPDAVVARVNLSRAEAAAPAPDGRPALDSAYLVGLGADAVPALVAGLDRLGPGPRCALATSLVVRWQGEGEPGWRGETWSDRRARSAVRALAGERWVARC